MASEPTETTAPTPTPAAPPAETRPDARAENRQQCSSASATASSLRELDFVCLLNTRYHEAREAFLDSTHRWLMFFVIVFGSGAVVAAGLELGLPKWINAFLGASSAVFGALDLAFDLTNRARNHALMKRRYYELLADLKEGKKSKEEAESLLPRYYADEEPSYRALLMLAWNEAQEMIYGDEKRTYIIPPRNRFWKHVFRYEGVSFQLSEPKRK
ncbi:MAG: hypothetical protein WC722_13895 [Rhodospirillales bacterium]|jgi:hypothetical protein